MITRPPNIMDYVPLPRSIARTAGHEAVCAAPDTPDGDLYRILVAHALCEGRFDTKVQFDDHVRALSTVMQADQILAHRKLRPPECEVFRTGDLMMCECGSTWKIDAIDPPNCKRSIARK